MSDTAQVFTADEVAMDEHISFPESSVIFWRYGELWIDMRGKLYPQGGGVECGTSSMSVNLTEHLRDVVRSVLKEQQT